MAALDAFPPPLVHLDLPQRAVTVTGSLGIDHRDLSRVDRAAASSEPQPHSSISERHSAGEVETVEEMNEAP